MSIQLFSDEAAEEILQGFSELERDIITTVQRGETGTFEQLTLAQRGIQQAVEGVTAAYVDTERNVFKTVNNVGDNLMFSGRYLAKNVVGLIDNTQDHVFELINDTRTDISNGVQMFGILVGAGIVAMLILYGDKILQRGFQVAEFSIF